MEKERLAILERYSNLGPLARLTFEAFDTRRVNLIQEQRQSLEQALRAAKVFANELHGWLVLQGINGCGKTHLAASIGNYILKQGRPVLLISAADLLDHLRSAFNPTSEASYDDQFERVRNAPLLILDDLGEHSATPWAQEKLYQIISHRYNSILPTVITTCLSLDEIEPRISSRLLDPRVSNLIVITAPDYRSDLRLGGGKRSGTRRRG
jgi:DNA replication protein DnaC